MKNETKVKLYSGILLACILIFVLQIFVFEAPNGTLGFLLVLMCFYGVIGSLSKLCKLSKRFKNSFLTALDLFFFLP